MAMEIAAEWHAASQKMQCEKGCLLLLKEETTPGLKAGILLTILIEIP